jgi:Zn-dependent protease
LASLSSLNIAIAIIWIALFVLVAAPVHECAHAFTAWRLGDGTAKLMGRVSLDPVVHFDPIGGTVMILSTLVNLFAGNPIGFGWAKPTPVYPYNLRGRHAQTLVAAAGPLSNLLLAALFAVGFRILWSQGIAPNNQSAQNMVQLVLYEGVVLNVLLMIFNLFPLPPLDGSHVLLDQLDPRTSREVGAFFDQYGLILLILFIFFAWGIIGPITWPIVSFLIGVPV